MLESVRRHLNAPDLQIHMLPEWGSQNPDHRELLHAKRDQLLKASATPLHSSIAHTEGMGILVLSEHAIGVDVEVTERVKEKVIARISTADELAAAPSAASLWTAKEATFKSLKSFNQPSVLSNISVGGWKNIGSQYETFQLVRPHNYQIPSDGQGVCLQLSSYSFGFFVIRS